MRAQIVLIALLVNCWDASIATPGGANFAKTTCEAVTNRVAPRGKPNGQGLLVLTPQLCRKHIGEHATVKFIVDNVHACRKGHVYLNESGDYKKCFAAIISVSGRKHFAADLNKAYKGKTVKVTGVLETYGGTPKIVLDSPQQIVIE